jgi:hypothetical protein
MARRFVVVALALLSSHLLAQTNEKTSFQVIRPVQQAVSLPLSMYPVSSGERNGEEAVPVGQSPRSFGAETGNSGPVLQSTFEPLSATAGLKFNGVVNGIPPDANIAVGPNHIVQWVNFIFSVWNKSGSLFAGYPKAGNSLWTALGGPCAADNDGDPIVQYDRLADRWVMTQFANVSAGPPYYQCIAVSTSGDPTATYNLYSYSFTPNFIDYPKLGVWPTGYFMSFNLFSNPNGGSFQGVQVCAFDRSQMLIGGAATAICYLVTGGQFTLLPSDLDGAVPPAANSPNVYITDAGGQALQLFAFTPNFSNPNASTFTGPTSLGIGESRVCSNSHTTCIPQPGTTQKLDALDDRLMYRNAYRRFDTYDSLVVAQTVAANGGAGVAWFEIRSPAVSPTLFQNGTYAPDSSYRWMGSIATDFAGDMGLGYNLSNGTSIYPGIAYTGRLVTDPLNTMQSESVLISGQGAQTNINRWGDYSAMRIDPTDDCTFWFTSEYVPAPSSLGTEIGSFRFPSCPSVFRPTQDANDAGCFSASSFTIPLAYDPSGVATFSTLSARSGAVGNKVGKARNLSGLASAGSGVTSLNLKVVSSCTTVPGHGIATNCSIGYSSGSGSGTIRSGNSWGQTADSVALSVSTDLTTLTISPCAWAESFLAGNSGSATLNVYDVRVEATH